MQLTAKNVDEVFLDCLWGDEHENTSAEEMVRKSKLVHGVTTHVGFNPAQLEKRKADIASMLGQLPEKFTKGWSFLNGCMTENGIHWGEQLNVDQLFMLGTGIDRVTCPLPREVWSALPGGVPYYQVLPARNFSDCDPED